MIAHLVKKAPALILALPVSLVLLAGTAEAQQGDYRAALAQIAEKLAGRFPHLSGAVVAIKGRDIYLSMGRESGATKGVRLRIYRRGAEFRHPTTGVVLGTLEDEVGEVEVAQVRDKFSVARPVRLSPGQSPRVGDTARRASSKIRLAVLPFVNRARERYSTDTLTRELARLLAAGGRFDVYDVDRLQVWFLESGVSAEDALEGENPRKLGEQARTDMALRGEVSEIDGRIILSVRLLSLATKKEIFRAVAIARELPYERLVPKEQALRRGQGAPGAPGAGLVPSRGLGGGGAIVGRSVPGAGGGGPKSFGFGGVAFRGISVADVDADGKNEIVAITEGALIVHRMEGGRLREVARFSDGGSDFRWIDIADMNGDGTPEIYLAAYRARELFSLVLQMKGTDFNVLRRNDRTFYRLLRVRRPAGGAKIADSDAYLLLGQGEGAERPFDGGIHRYRWAEGNLVKGAAYPLPRRLTILGFGLWDINKDGGEEVVEVGADNRLRVFTRRGDELFSASGTYGVPVYHFVHASADVDEDRDHELDGTALPIRSRVLIADLGGDGVDEVLLIRNELAAAVVPGLGVSGGRVAALVWDGSGLSETWSTRRLGLGVVDFALADADGDGRDDLVVATASPGAFSAARSRLLVYGLK